MRVDSLSSIPAEARTNVADLLGRLDTGDVIKAKVIEITSNEVVLRLFDGSVLKAAAGESLEAKAGQTLTLAVTSRTEGTLYLETVKDPSQLNSVKPDNLKSMLDKLQINPNTRNMELAAEFMKAGILATAALFDKAAILMEDFKYLNAEKAVFITSKGFQTDPNKLELLIKLLDGDLKLGEQLKVLQTAINNISKSFNKSTPNDAFADAFIEAADTALASKAAPAPNVTAQASQQTAASNGIAVKAQTPEVFSEYAQLKLNIGASVGDSAPSNNLPATSAADTDIAANTSYIKNTLEGLQVNTSASAATAAAGQKEAAGLSTAAAGQKEAAGLSTVAASQQGAAGLSTAAAALEKSVSSTLSASTASASSTSASSALASTASGTVSGAPTASINEITGDAARKAEQSANMKETPVDKSIGNMSTLQHNAVSDPFTKLKDAIKELFVNINSEKLASELDVNKLNKDLNNKLDMLKAAIQTSDITRLTGGESITVTTALLDDSVKLLNQLNNNSMLYYQLPVNLSGYHTTAELYIMKRRQSQKRIDPHNTFMFVSLDTNNLGRIETLLDVKGNNVIINLRTEKQQINDLIRENIKYLYSGLAGNGYKLVDIRYAIIDSASSPMKQEQLLSKMMSSNHCKVDMRI